jgi:hypothetical protein
MTISGPIYSRGATLGINTVKSYNRFASANSKTVVANEVGYSYTEDEGGRGFVDVGAGTGVTVLVSGVPDKSIEVTNYMINASGATVVSWLSGSNTIAGPFNMAANATIVNDSKSLRTNRGESLSINLTASVVNGHLSYRLV